MSFKPAHPASRFQNRRIWTAAISFVLAAGLLTACRMPFSADSSAPGQTAETANDAEAAAGADRRGDWLSEMQAVLTGPFAAGQIVRAFAVDQGSGLIFEYPAFGRVDAYGMETLGLISDGSGSPDGLSGTELSAETLIGRVTVHTFAPDPADPEGTDGAALLRRFVRIRTADKGETGRTAGPVPDSESAADPSVSQGAVQPGGEAAAASQDDDGPSDGKTEGKPASASSKTAATAAPTAPVETETVGGRIWYRQTLSAGGVPDVDLYAAVVDGHPVVVELDPDLDALYGRFDYLPLRDFKAAARRGQQSALRALLETVRYETDPVSMLRVPDAALLSNDAGGGVSLLMIGGSTGGLTDGSKSDAGLSFSDRKSAGRLVGWYETAPAAGDAASDAGLNADRLTERVRPLLAARLAALRAEQREADAPDEAPAGSVDGGDPNEAAGGSGSENTDLPGGSAASDETAGPEDSRGPDGSRVTGAGVAAAPGGAEAAVVSAVLQQSAAGTLQFDQEKLGAVVFKLQRIEAAGEQIWMVLFRSGRYQGVLADLGTAGLNESDTRLPAVNDRVGGLLFALRSLAEVQNAGADPASQGGWTLDDLTGGDRAGQPDGERR